MIHVCVIYLQISCIFVCPPFFCWIQPAPPTDNSNIHLLMKLLPYIDISIDNDIFHLQYRGRVKYCN